MRLFGNLTGNTLGKFTNAGQLLLSGVLNNTGQTFNFTNTSGDFTLSNGEIRGGIVQQVGANGLAFDTNSSTNILDGVTVRGDLNISENSQAVIRNGLVVKSENGRLLNYVTLNVRGRDAVEFVEEAKRVVEQKVKVPEGVHLEWSGGSETMRR